MADGWQHKREVRGGVGDWRLREEESGSWGDEDLDCGVWRGRRVSFVGCYWANILKFSWAIIQIRYCSVNSVYRGTEPNLPWFFRYLNMRTEHEPIIFDSVFFGSVLDPLYFMPSSSCTYTRIDSIRFVTPRRALVFNN
jgi:hypothetical protein